VRKRFLESELDNSNSMLDIDENSLEYDDLWCTSKESSAPGSSNDE
jgi:hypothetical protein